MMVYETQTAERHDEQRIASGVRRRQSKRAAAAPAASVGGGRPLESKMQLRDILIIKTRERGLPRIHSVPPEVLLLDALKTMARHTVGSLVVSNRGRFLGLMTRSDVVQALSLRGAEALEATVGEIMNTQPIISRPGDAIDQVRKVMSEHRISHVAVIEDGRLLDVISRHDLADAAYAECRLENRMLKHYIKNWPEPDRAA